jgi:hypothetical protein
LLPSPDLRSSVFPSPREEQTRQPDELALEANLECRKEPSFDSGTSQPVISRHLAQGLESLGPSLRPHCRRDSNRKLGTRTHRKTPGGRAAPKGIGTARALLSLPLILLIPLDAKNFLVVPTHGVTHEAAAGNTQT